jgi:hypothetical protein
MAELCLKSKSRSRKRMTEENPSIDKRKHKRVRTVKRVKAIISDNELDALLHDISSGGAALGIVYIAHPDDKIEVMIEGIGNVIGKVVRPIDQGLAVRFIDIDVETEKSLLSFVNNQDDNLT